MQWLSSKQVQSAESMPELTKEQWKSAGLRAGWIKKAQTNVDYAMDAVSEASAGPHMVFDRFSESWVNMNEMSHANLVETFKSGEFDMVDKDKIRKKLQTTLASEVIQGLRSES